MSILYKLPNGNTITPHCKNCSFVKESEINNNTVLHCSKLPMAENNKIGLVQKNNFREFIWNVELIPKESIIVPARFACNQFNPIFK